MTDITNAYIAGFIDGEAHIRIRKRTHRSTPYVGVRIQLSNTEPEVLKAIQSKYGGQLAERPNGANTIWRLEWYKLDEIEGLLDEIFPYLIVKREEAKLLLEYIRLRKQSTRYTDESWALVDEFLDMTAHRRSSWS